MSHLNLSISLNFSKGGVILNRNLSDSITVAGDAVEHNTQLIGTTEEAIEFPAAMANIGYVLLHNLDATHFVQVGRTAGVYNIKLLPGEICLFRLSEGTAILAKADTAECNIEKILIEV